MVSSLKKKSRSGKGMKKRSNTGLKKKSSRLRKRKSGLNRKSSTKLSKKKSSRLSKRKSSKTGLQNCSDGAHGKGCQKSGSQTNAWNQTRFKVRSLFVCPKLCVYIHWFVKLFISKFNKLKNILALFLKCLFLHNKI